jgi:enoyl-CoA hydratase/carnithine racemase
MSTVLSSRVGGVATLTLNRPERLNAYTGEMGGELYAALHELDQDDAVRVIIVTGAGRAFCAGADLGAGEGTFAGDRAFGVAAGPEARVRPWNLRKPIIAAINGAAVGIGATLPLQWDIRLASDRARIGYVFTRRGITPEVLSSWLLPRIIGFSRAMELLISGRILTAAEALELGIVSRVVPHDDLLRVAGELAADIAANTSPLAVATVKRLLWRQLMEPDPRAALRRENEVFNWIGKQADAAEGVTAFLDKRAPRWQTGASRDVAPALPDLPEE